MSQIPNTLTELNTGVVALSSLCSGFADVARAKDDAHSVTPEGMPDPYRQLLAHQEHMTSRLSGYYGEPVVLSVLDEQTSGDFYARKILLTVESTEQVVEFGIARLNLALIHPDVRTEILQRKIPLGDLLIKHDVMRRIDPKWYFRFGPASPFVEEFTTNESVLVFGRVGIIHCNEQPAIQLLEVVTDAKRDRAATNP